MRRRLAVLAFALSAFALAGCTSSPSIPELEREQVAEDRPAALQDVSDLVDLETIRFSGSFEDLDIYLARGLSSFDEVCLLIVRNGQWDSSGCGGGWGLGLRIADGTRLEVGTFRYPGDEERIGVSESVRVVSSAWPS